MVPHLGGGLCREKIAARCIEEREDCTVFKGWGIRDIHDDLCIGKRPIEALARDRVDARAGRGLQHVVALLAEPARELRADQASPPMMTIFMAFPHFTGRQWALRLNVGGG